MRTLEDKLETKARKAAERAAHRAKVFATHPPSVRYAKAKFKSGKKAQNKKRQAIKLGVQ